METYTNLEIKYSYTAIFRLFLQKYILFMKMYHDEKHGVHISSSSPNVIRVTALRRKGWARHVDKRNT
jgi:hypothetical protein